MIGDAQRLKQVLLNLVGNAIKFTERGSVDADADRAVDVGFGTAGVRFEVSDTGIGIPPDAIERLFQPFHQVVGMTKRRPAAPDSGLAISQRIVEAMGSTNSTSRATRARARDSGSRLVFDVDRSETHPVPDRFGDGGLDGDSTLAGTALVVEDNEVNRMIAREVLQSLGMRRHRGGEWRRGARRVGRGAHSTSC